MMPDQSCVALPDHFLAGSALSLRKSVAISRNCFKGGFEGFDDFLGKHVRIEKAIGSLKLSSLSQNMSRPALSRL